MVYSAPSLAEKFARLRDALSLREESAQTAAARTLKNAVIGSAHKKSVACRAGLLDALLGVLRAPAAAAPLLREVCVACGSLVLGTSDELPGSVSRHELCAALFARLHHADWSVVEAAARALRHVLEGGVDGVDELLAQYVLPHMRTMLDVAHPQAAAAVCRALAVCCRTPQIAARFVDSGAALIVEAVVQSGRVIAVEAALELLDALLTHSIALCERVCASATLQTLCGLVRDRRTRLQFLACCCLTRMASVADIRAALSAVLVDGVLPSLVKLLQDAEFQAACPAVIAELARSDAVLQRAASDADVLSKLTDFACADASSSELRANALLALASLASLVDSSRTQLVQSKLAGQLPALLADPSDAVRGAACSCLRSLSRSVRTVRSVLVERGLMTALLPRLEERDPAILSEALATMCNLVLDFCPLKAVAVEAGCVAVFASCFQHRDPKVRLHAVWAMKNLLFMADNSVKARVLAKVSFQAFFEFIRRASSPFICEQLTACVRNLLCFKGAESGPVVGEHVQLIVDSLKDLLGAHGMADGPPISDKVQVQAVYALANLASADTEYRDLVAKQGDLLQRVGHTMTSVFEPLRVASIWLLLNLVWEQTHAGAARSSATSTTLDRLRTLGIDRKLQFLMSDASLDVRDRVRTLLELFQ